MLLFHGTGGDRALVDAIFEDGLIPQAHTWAHDTTGIDTHVFACTSPIGGRGGDPIHFAQRRTYGPDARAWLLVLDVPRDIVRGAVPNHELEQYWKVRAFAQAGFSPLSDTIALLAHRRRERVPTRELLDYDVKSTAEGLCEGTPDAHTLVQFEDAYLRVSRREEKARVAASYGLRLPESWSRDPHYAWCAGCMHNLFEVDIVARDIPSRTTLSPDEPAGSPRTLRFQRGAWDRLDLTLFGLYTDALDRWLAAHGDPGLTTFAQLQARFPPPRDSVPRSMWPDFVTHDLDARMREPDTQVLLPAISPAQIVGAIDLGTSSKLSSLVRPSRGESLHDKLWYLARKLADERADARKPILLD